MKASELIVSELRIGNYMSLYGILVEMTSLDFNFEESHIKPIPLTEEWLLKFGFEHNIYKTDNLPYYEKGFLSIDIFNECYINDEKIELKYVHQLQNIYFALTGEELTFKSEQDEKTK